jgi:peptide/nickel transport system permease protein
MAPPSAQHWLGTDNLGRDELSNIIYGARVSVVIGLSATLLITVVSVVIGASSALIGGRFDLLVQRFVDAWLCIPGMLVLLIMVTILGKGTWQIVVAIGLPAGIGGSRMIRSAVFAIKENAYVDAARAVGSSTWSILTRHIIPNIMPVIIIGFSMMIGGAILMEASLSFLGFGVPPGVPSWGSMLSQEGRSYMEMAPMLALWPGLALTLVVWGTNMLGDALRDLLDPRLKGGLGRYGGPKGKLKIPPTRIIE